MSEPKTTWKKIANHARRIGAAHGNQSTGWRPISTVPRGEDIILGSWHPGFGALERDGWVNVTSIDPGDDVTKWKMRPTHWMPLPEPPKKEINTDAE